jgi:serine/threonine protein kinase
MNHQGDLKLGSFGGARMLEDTMEKAMTIVGSPCNLSPEVVEGKAYDNKIDIWGLGCLVYELATHQHPFKINSLPELYEMIVKNPPQDLPIKYSKYLNPIYKY